MSKINTNKEQPDLLGDLFKRIPEEELPASFRSNVMRQIMLESAKAKKRDERFSLLAAIVASLIMISLAIVSFVYMEIPKIAAHDKHIGLGFLFIHRGHHAHTSIGGL